MSWCTSASEICKHCKLSDFQEGYGPRTLLICDGCETIGSHIECEERVTCKKISVAALTGGHSWYCSEVGSLMSLNLLTFKSLLSRCNHALLSVYTAEYGAGRVVRR